MPNKNYCDKCGDRHFPPTGKKCKRVKEVEEGTDEEVVGSQHNASSMVLNSMDKNFDMPQDGVPVAKAKKSASVKKGKCSESAAHTSMDNDFAMPPGGVPVVKAKKSSGY